LDREHLALHALDRIAPAIGLGPQRDRHDTAAAIDGRPAASDRHPAAVDPTVDPFGHRATIPSGSAGAAPRPRVLRTPPDPALARDRGGELVYAVGARCPRCPAGSPSRSWRGARCPTRRSIPRASWWSRISRTWLRAGARS